MPVLPRSWGAEGGGAKQRAAGRASATGACLPTDRCHDPRCSMAMPAPPSPCHRAQQGHAGPQPVLCVLEGTVCPTLDSHSIREGMGVPAMPCVPPGLRDTEWLGRTQVLSHGPVTWYLDGAHTTSSIQACVRWFRQAALNQDKPHE